METLSTRIRAAFALALAGATVGTLFDWLHVVNGAIAYERPELGGVAWWTPVLYTGAGVAIGMSHALITPREPKPGALSAQHVAMAMTAFLAIWYATGALPISSLAKTAVLVPASVGVWWVFDGTLAGAGLALATAAGGVLVETTLVRICSFRYLHPDALGIVWWLPAIYVSASVAVGNLGRALVARVSPRAEAQPAL